MAALDDALTALGTEVDAAGTRVTNDVAKFKTTIADLQAQVDAGTATPAQVQLLAELTTKVKAIDPTDSTVAPAAGFRRR